MKRLRFFAFMMVLWSGAAPGFSLRAEEARPSLAVLPLKEEGRRDLGEVSDIVNALVASAVADSGAFRAVDPSLVMAALPELKLKETDPAYRSSLIALGKRLGARYILTGSYFPERNLANNGVSITLSLRLVNAGDASESSRFLETGEGATLGGLVATLRRQLSARMAGGAPLPLAPVSAPVPTPAALPATTPALAESVQAAPVPAPVSALPAAVKAGAPLPSKKALLVLRPGSLNGVYFQNGGLSRYGASLADFDFLLKALAKRFPPEFEVTLDHGPFGADDDLTMNRKLVAEYHPDTLVVMTLQCSTKTQQTMVLFSKTRIQAELRIEVLTPATLEVMAGKTVQTDFVELKGSGKTFAPELKAQLAERMAVAVQSLAF